MAWAKSRGAIFEALQQNIPIFLFDDLKDLEELPADCALVRKDAHFVPFWQKRWHGPAMVRPWLQEESVGFANPFRELAQKLSCH